MYHRINLKVAVISMLLGCLLILSFPLLSWAGKGQIIGEVYDNFGQPVEGVNVVIEGTAFETQTNALGKFSISYVPGNQIVLKMFKEGYLEPQDKKLSITVESTYPMKRVYIGKLTPNEGAYLRGVSDYLPLKINELSTYKQEEKMEGLLKIDLTTYKIKPFEFSNIRKGKGKTLTFCSKSHLTVVRISGDEIECNNFRICNVERIPHKIIIDMSKLYCVSCDMNKFDNEAIYGLSSSSSYYDLSSSFSFGNTDKIYLFKIVE